MSNTMSQPISQIKEFYEKRIEELEEEHEEEFL